MNYIARIVDDYDEFMVGVYESEEMALIALFNTLAENEFLFNLDDTCAFWNDVDDEMFKPDIRATKKKHIIQYFREKIHSISDLQRICTYYSENNFEEVWRFQIEQI